MSEYRTSVEDVRQELESEEIPIDELSDTQVETVGLVPATLVVDEDLADRDMSDDRLALLERYLAGHFVLSSGAEELRQVDQQGRSDGSSESFARPSSRESGYDETSLGRKAIAIDNSGTLAEANKPTASITVPDTKGSARRR